MLFGTLAGGLGCFLSMRLISHGLTPTYRLPGIHGLITFGKLMQPPWVFSALPP